MDIVSDVLSLLQLKSTVYFRSSFHEPWGIGVPKFENVARFHFVHRGRCWLTISDETVELNQGDLIIIPYGVAHSIHSPIDAPIEPLGEASLNYDGDGIFVYGDRSSRVDTQLVCGHWSFDKHLSHPLIDSLPKYIHIKRSAVMHSWLEQSLEMIGRETEIQQPGYKEITKKISEAIFIHTVSDYLKRENANIRFYGALKDKSILDVLNHLHASPASQWNIDRMSEIANMSRTGFISRFTCLVGTTPLQYLTHWRLQLSCRLLLSTDTAIISIAEQVGYQSEASFGRVFKKHFNIGPGSYRLKAKLVEVVQ